MAIEALGIMKTVFSACVGWINQLFSALDASGVVLAGFCIMLVVNLLFIPLRGGGLVASFDTFSDFNKGMIHKGKYSNGKIVHGSFHSGYKGKYEKGNNAANLSRRGRHSQYYAGGSGKQGI